MLRMSEDLPWMTTTRYFGPAGVLEIEELTNRILLSLKIDDDIHEVWAQIAIPAPLKLEPGDRVLAMGEDTDELYVIGILDTAKKEVEKEKSLNLSGGTRAQISGPQDEQTIQIFSNKRELLFEYNEKEGKARINLESGDIEFISQKGNINFYAAQDILLHGKTVGITGRSGIVLGILNTLNKGNIKIEKTNVTGEQFAGKFNFVTLTMDRFETFAQTVIQKARNVYHTVSELSQFQTGRMRTLVKSTFHLKSKKVFLKAEEDVKVRGEKIHLG
jgi:hypothetical protein